jgi:predicted nucleic acid-binding protein
MSVDAFFDTNVLLYQLDKTDPHKHTVAERLISKALSHGDACISFQVVQECLNAVLRKAHVRLDTAQAHAWLDSVLDPLCRVQPSADFYRRGLDIQARWKFGFYDSLIVAAALEAGCKRLYSEDLQHGQRIEGLRIENPFKGA